MWEMGRIPTTVRQMSPLPPDQVLQQGLPEGGLGIPSPLVSLYPIVNSLDTYGLERGKHEKIEGKKKKKGEKRQRENERKRGGKKNLYIQPSHGPHSVFFGAYSSSWLLLLIQSFDISCMAFPCCSRLLRFPARCSNGVGFNPMSRYLFGRIYFLPFLGGIFLYVLLSISSYLLFL
jgi:hypothetical protein